MQKHTKLVALFIVVILAMTSMFMAFNVNFASTTTPKIAQVQALRKQACFFACLPSCHSATLISYI